MRTKRRCGGSDSINLLCPHGVSEIRKSHSTRDADESYYNEFNDLAVSANILVTEINSYIGKQIEKDVCESLIARCEEMNGKYKALEEKIDALADRTTVPPSENGD